ncbi:acyl-CoA thioesterase [Jiulongibacter sp. NS-SX5]|uniref:acyl-CoA thioesterase n=1 Tax=Jiulongibacter sp. NS-SX5 TaxID=3463854 RepID=UPI00405A2DA1
MQTHKTIITVEQSHLDELEHVNNAVYLKFLEKAAIAHWYSLADEDTRAGIRWIARRHEIDYLKPAFLHDKLVVETWIEKYDAISTERHYVIKKDQQVIAKALTIWVAIDPNSMKPKRVSSNILQKFESLL